MWSQKYKMSPQRRVPVVHEQIAMQCARSIMRMASALPQPPSRSPSGHVPILVELRRTDESTVYRYQVNVPPTGWPLEEEPSDGTGTGTGPGPSTDTDLQVLMLPELMDSLGPKLPDIPPCPMHGHSGLDPTPGYGSVPAPPLVMSQTFVHVIHKEDSPPAPGNITTCIAPAMAAEVTDSIQEHFKATLYEEQPSPLRYSNIWLPEDAAAAGTAGPASSPSSSPVPVSPPRLRSKELTVPPSHCPQLLCLDENDEYVACKEERPLNGLRAETGRSLNEWARVPELCLDSNGEYVPNRLLQRPLNGCRPGRSLVEQPPPVQLPNGLNGLKALNGLNGLNGLKGLNGFKGLNSYPNGLQKNGYKSVDQRMAYTDHDKVMRLRIQKHFQNWPGQMPGRSDSFEPRVRHEEHPMTLMPLEPSEPLDKPPLPSVTDVVVPSEALPQPHNLREPQTFFRWNYCTLCHTAMRTVRNAVDHYTSRAHDRRVSTFLGRQNFEMGPGPGLGMGTGTGIGTALGAVDTLALPEQVLRYLRKDRPSDLYCDLCDLRLTSVIHAEQHFYGRRHRQMERQLSEPSGQYDIKSHWMRKDTKLLMCELCDVCITSESQMAMHISGARHRKRAHTVRARGAFGLGPAPVDGTHMYEIHTNGTLAPLRPQGLLPVPNSIQFRPWGDPSAAFYCEACNVTLNHLKSVKQHENGRMHHRNLLRLPPQPMV